MTEVSVTPDLVCRIRDLVTTVVSREGYIDFSEDVGQEFVVELLKTTSNGAIPNKPGTDH